MRRFVILMALPLALATTAPALAQATDPETEPRSWLDGLRDNMDDALGDLQGLAETWGPAMRSFIEEMGPALNNMMDEVKDWSRYETPEMLPNGDIIIRRKPDAPDPDAPEDPPVDPTDPGVTPEEDPIEI
ncbi:hypothetical protein [Marinibacterium sp. SX1]|uniref:hypothetical protein n=1 Tax=Marinibacterium sp. SX1 TaxID=3388424 RepID=UPI003D169058